MYFNVFGEKVSRKHHQAMVNARENRQALIAAQCGRRELFKLGFLTSAGYLLAQSGLSARANAAIPLDQSASPPVTPFVEPLPIPPIKQPVPALDPVPTQEPNRRGREARTRPHQVFNTFAPGKLYEVHQQLARVVMSPDLPEQKLWGFDGLVPGPTYVARYGEPILVRNRNDLPRSNGGFGMQEVTTHLHNAHTPSESDGNPCDFFGQKRWYDQHYPNVLAGILSTHPDVGDINEALSTLWYHDHRVDFTSQNVYKGLAGFYLLFNDHDTGDESTGFHLPSFPDFDIPLLFADKVFDDEGKCFFDLFNVDGILGDRFTVNGKIQPFFQVHPRRYRFRLLNVGPSRFYEIFLTDRDEPNARLPFWQIANDGNLLPKPVQVESVRIGPAERVDVIVDFQNLDGKRIYFENRLKQVDGRGPLPPPDDIKAAGQGDFLMRCDVELPGVRDNSQDPAAIEQFYELPDTTAAPRMIRTVKFDRLNGQWSINGQFMDCDVRFQVKQNSIEHWVLSNLSGDWQHPIHIHLEEHQLLSRNRQVPPLIERSRKDVTRLQHNETVRLFLRFRDFLGPYPLHCHNTVHEDHAMMLLWEVSPEGDQLRVP